MKPGGYTNLRALGRADFRRCAGARPAAKSNRTRRSRCSTNRPRRVAADGQRLSVDAAGRRPDQRRRGLQPAGSCAARSRHVCCASRNPLSDADQQRWALLNTALFVDGLYLKITSRLPMPLVILHVAAADGASNIAYPARHHRGDSGIQRHHHRTPRGAGRTHAAQQLQHAHRACGTIRRSNTTACSPRAPTPPISIRSAIRQDQDSQCKQFTIVSRRRPGAHHPGGAPRQTGRLPR